MARNTMKLELKGFNELVTKLEGLQGDVKKAVTDALERAGETIGDDTEEAVDKKYLPAGGKYSQGDTKKTIVKKPKVEWSGNFASIGVGFDFGEPGAGGYLITGYYYSYHGTPRHMEPDKKLQDIYKKKKYMNSIQKDMAEVVNGYIMEKMEG